MAGQGLLEPLDLARVPNASKLFPNFQQLKELSVDGAQYALPFSWGSCPLMYNSNEVKETPTSWLDFMKPEYKGKVALVNDPNITLLTWVRVVSGEKIGTRATPDQLNQAVELLIKLKKEHVRTIASSYGELVDLFGRGEIVMAQGWEPIASWVGDKAPIKWTSPKEGAVSFVDAYAMAKGAPDLDAAYEVLNEALSVEGQVASAVANMTPVVNADAVGQLDDFNRSYYPYDSIEKFFTETATLDPMYVLEDDGIHATWQQYQDAWEQFLKA